MKNSKKSNSGIIAQVFKSMFAVQIMTMLTGIIGSVVDGMVIGKFLGQNAMAAFGFTTSISLVVAIIGGILSTGSSVVCSKSLGEGNPVKNKRSFSVCFTSALIVASCLAVLIVCLAKPAAKLMGAEGEMLSLAADYIFGYGIACPGIVLVAFLMPIMQMNGEMNRLLAAVVIMTAGNIAANFVNVLVLNGGMFGMAMATAFSYYLSLLYLSPHLLKKEAVFSRPSLMLDKKIIGTMVSSGFPTAISQLGRLLLTFFLNRYLMARWGGAAVAAHTVIMSAGNLCMVPGTALSSSVQVITGVLYGEEDRTGLKNLMGTAMKYNVIVNGACMVFFMCLAQPVVSMFYNGDSAAIATTIAGFRLYTLCMIFYGTNLIYRSYLQGTGQIKKSYALSICDCFLCPFLMSLLLGSLFGIPSIWLCYVLGEGITTIVMLALFRFRKCDVQGFGAFVPMPDALGKDILAIHEYSISENREDLSVRLSQDVSVFCTENGATVRQTYLVSLTVEEVVGNIMERGFSDGKAHHIDLRILRKSDGWTLRIRDDCPLFNPARYLEQFTDDDPSANIGLKLIRGIASDMVYLNALKLNNLMIRI